MTMKKTIALLREHQMIEVRRELSPGQIAAVNRGWAYMQCYRDQSGGPDIPYPFRPWRFYLGRGERLHDLMKREKEELPIE